jgi:hypothetical protein
MMVVVHTDYCEYLALIFFGYKCVINADYWKTELECPDASTKTKEGPLKNVRTTSGIREMKHIIITSWISFDADCRRKPCMCRMSSQTPASSSRP